MSHHLVMRFADFNAQTGWDSRAAHRAAERGLLRNKQLGSGHHLNYSEHDVLVARVLTKVDQSQLRGSSGGHESPHSRMMRTISEALYEVPDPENPPSWLVLTYSSNQEVWRWDLLESAEQVSRHILADDTKTYLALDLDRLPT